MRSEELNNQGAPNLARRSFLRNAGIGAASVGLLAVAGCSKDSHPSGPATPKLTGQSLAAVGGRGSFDVGSGDIGVLNFAYALEQLEAAFYIQACMTPYSGITGIERAYLIEIRDHEILHRAFFKAALGAQSLPPLTVDFSSIDFTSRASVLGAAKAFEDTGVMAYDGAGYLIQNPAYLTIAGKIVSVEARHAALIRDLITPGSFVDSDVIDSNGLNKTMTIAQVLAIANTYLKTKVSAAAYNYKAS